MIKLFENIIIVWCISFSHTILIAQDISITQDSSLLKRSENYENQFWNNLEQFRSHVLFQIDNNGYAEYTDAEAKELGYSSALGLAIYHTLDEMYSLSWVLDATQNDLHRDKYAELAKEFIDLIVDGVITGQGTASG